MTKLTDIQRVILRAASQRTDRLALPLPKSLKGDFEYQGRPYKSLSAIARAITGTQWSGPVFFGLKSSRNLG